MSGVLSPAPPIEPGETPQSYVHRLSIVNGIPDVREFCRLIGLDYRGILIGSKPALEFLAELVGLPISVVSADAVTRDNDGYSYRGQQLVGHSLRRDRVVACPACLRDDFREGRATHARGLWLISHSRTCPQHSVALVEMSRSSRGRYGLDFTPIVAPIADELDGECEKAEERRASDLERYVSERITAGKTRQQWLDTMPLHAAAKSCELMGAVAVFGPEQNLNHLTEDDWHKAGAEGFAVAQGGAPAIKAFLHDLRMRPTAKRATSHGAQAWFGRLYQALAYGSENSGFDPLRDVMRDYLVWNTPVGSGEIILGQRVATRRVHSIRTAFRETRVHATRLRKILAKLGQISLDGDRMSDHELQFDAIENADLLSRLSTAMTFRELPKYLSTNRVQAELLIKEKLIRPVVPDDDGDIGWEVFAQRDVDMFIGELLMNADPALDGAKGMMDITSAAKRACCHSMEIVRLVLDGRLRRIGRAAGASRYSAVLVDIEEVRAMVRGQELDGVTVDRAFRSLGINPNAMKVLVHSGVIATTIQRHPVNRSPLRIVSHRALDDFRNAYVALFDASRQLGIHPVKLKKALETMGVRPAFDPVSTKATIYRRDEVPRQASDFEPSLIAIKWPDRQAKRKQTASR